MHCFIFSWANYKVQWSFKPQTMTSEALHFSRLHSNFTACQKAFFSISRGIFLSLNHKSIIAYFPIPRHGVVALELFTLETHFVAWKWPTLTHMCVCVCTMYNDNHNNVHTFPRMVRFTFCFYSSKLLELLFTDGLTQGFINFVRN